MDLETLVSSVCAGGSDRKIACESLASDDVDPKIRPVFVSADYPPESYSLSKEAQIEWLNENAFFERKESQRGNSSPAPNSNSNTNTSSHRISLKSKTSIIRLPKPQKACFNEANKRRNCRIARTLMFPKRIGSRSKSNPSLTEPSSPKVSCIGRVRSKRERSRRMQRQKSGRTGSFNRSGSKRDKPVRVKKSGQTDSFNRSGSKRDKPVGVKKSGFFATFRAMFKTGGGCKDLSASGVAASQRDATTPPRKSSDIRTRLSLEEVGNSSPPRKSIGLRRSIDGGEPVLPGLGGMTRFRSGRRPDLLVEV